jgi:hypothetical protein
MGSEEAAVKWSVPKPNATGAGAREERPLTWHCYAYVPSLAMWTYCCGVEIYRVPWYRTLADGVLGPIRRSEPGRPGLAWPAMTAAAGDREIGRLFLAASASYCFIAG